MRLQPTTLVHDLPLTLASQIAEPLLVASDDEDSAMPADLRSWLVSLRLLNGVPFANLVADTDLLPMESIRWFYLDRRWTDALVQGALSVGTVTTDDRIDLTAAYPAIRDELDTEERNVRRGAGSARFGGRVGAVSGFILRSAAVAGWPGLHVRAFSVDPDEADDARYADDDPRRLRLLRLERLAPGVLFALFDGIPEVVHLEEPRQGVQFGVDIDTDGGGVGAVLPPRDRDSFDNLPGDPVPVMFRNVPGASGVIDIAQLERDLAQRPGTGAADDLDSAEYALQMIRFPYRQVWGDAEVAQYASVFTATIAYGTWATTTRDGG